MSRTAVRRGIYGKLSGDSTLSNLLGTAAPNYSKAIYYEYAPQKAQFPYVILSRSAGTPTWTLASEAYKDDIWQVKGVTKDTPEEGTADKADSIGDRIQALLTDASLSISDRTVLWLRPESEFDYAEVVDGVAYRHAGSDYRLKHRA